MPLHTSAVYVRLVLIELQRASCLKPTLSVMIDLVDVYLMRAAHQGQDMVVLIRYASALPAKAQQLALNDQLAP